MSWTRFLMPGPLFLFIAFLALTIASISVPTFQATDIVRVHFAGKADAGKGDMTELRLGIWGYCEYNTDNSHLCTPSHSGYSVQVRSPLDSTSATIGSSWTRGAAATPVAAGATLIAFALSLTSHLTISLIASLVSFLAAAITLIAFAIDIALFVYTKNQMRTINFISPTTITGPGFWLTFVGLIFLLIGGCTVCFVHRRNSRAAGGSSYELKGGLFSRFRS